MGIFIGILEEGLIYAILALGVLITYRILDFPDLTVDSSFPLGAAVSAILTVNGMHPVLTLLMATLAGAAAGLVNGLFGGGGGMVMAPLLTGWCGLEQKRALATCVGVILPFCVLSAAIYVLRGGFDWLAALPYLIGGGIGGALGGLLFRKVSAGVLRRLFALFLLYGGVRYLL